MKSTLPSIIPFALWTALHDRMLPQTEEIPDRPSIPPWVNAQYNIPKSIRKGKTWEEIQEIKKQIWIEQQLEGKAICLKCGKENDGIEEFFLTPKGVFCKSCIEAQEEPEATEC